MDIFSHALWGATVIRTRPLIWWAMLAGAAPDILGSGPGFWYLLLVKHRLWYTDTWELLLPWMQGNYRFWHSLVGAGLFLIFLLFLSERFWALIFPYLLHIFIDTFTHHTDVLARIFFPLVQYDASRAVGFKWWQHWWISAINAGLLVLVNVIIEYNKRQKKSPRSSVLMRP